MLPRIKIALRVPDTESSNRFFYFRLRSNLYTEPCEYKAVSKLFVVSDVESNFQNFCKLLIKHKIIDKYLNWIFGEGHLVILGNCFSQNEQKTECLWFIYSLEEKALSKGGYVHFILGDHEIMHIDGSWLYKHPPYALATPSLRVAPTALYNANYELRRWLETKNIMEKIGTLLFVHGGISTKINELKYSISDLNILARSFYLRLHKLVFNDDHQMALFTSEEAPYRYNGYYNGNAKKPQVNFTLAKFNVERIITGHTIQEQISYFFDTKVINVATDHTKGNSEGLLINKGLLFRADRQGRKEKFRCKK